jgi:tetratricopeptide (TPR) repeat protein
MKNHQRGRHGGLHISAQAANGFLLAAVAIALITLSNAHAAEVCTPAVARVVSVQGNVELRRPQDADWQSAKLNATLCAGDIVRVHERSRAALLLSNETTLRLDQKTTLTLAGLDDKASLLDLLTGALHVITRTPKPFKVKTPFLNANVEGTEFFVGVTEESAKVAVYEGRVTAANDQGSLVLASGELAIVAKNFGPRKEVMVRPRDAVQWALYYPTIFDYHLGVGISGTPGETALRDSIESYRSGDLTGALSRLENVPEGLSNPRFLTYRAGLLLLVGRLDEAKPDIERVLSFDPRSSDAYALQAVIAVVEDDKDKALDLSSKAIEFDPKSPTARLSRSYAEQAHFKIEDALASVREAVSMDPQNALAWARLAELQMSTGNLDSALAAAQRAVGLNSELAKTQTVLGFANLTRIDTKSAKASFEKAIELDPADPLSRLGLGLAKIREGDLEAGRQEIEIATILDPGNSLIRSYLGKAYYEEKRDRLAGKQFELAKERDPQDSTPWFYDAIRKQTENGPVEALQDLNTSIELNDNRAVYRSRLLIDDDKAARTTGAAAIYGELGFEKLAIAESVKALAENTENDSAHRQLAIAYAELPRHDIARVSEALQAQLRQPLTPSPMSPQISTDKLVILRETGPSRLGSNEFNWLFTGDQARLQLDGVAGSRGTLGDQFIVSGVAKNVAYAVSQLHHETNGFRDNNEAEKNIYDIFVQGELSPRASVQVDLKRTTLDAGETFFPFDPALVFPTKIKEDSDVVRLSGRYSSHSGTEFIWSVMHEDRKRLGELVPDGTVIAETDAHAYMTEFQQTQRFGESQIIAGLGHLAQKERFPLDETETESTSTNLYAYGLWRPQRFDLSVLAGLAGDSVKINNKTFSLRLDRKRLSPKLGILWSPRVGTTLRAAAFSSVKRPLIGSQTVEPTHVLGFNQFFSGFAQFFGEPEGTVSRRICAAIDQQLTETTFAGLEATGRRLSIPLVGLTSDFHWRETTGRLYLYKGYSSELRNGLLSGWQLSTTAEYEYEKLHREIIFTGPEGIVEVTTHRVPLGLNFFNGAGIVLRVSATYVRQAGVFSVDQGLPRFPKKDSAWITDASLGYRLPRRAGLLSIGVKNVFDRTIDLFETDPLNPRVATRRLVLGRLTLVF